MSQENNALENQDLSQLPEGWFLSALGQFLYLKNGFAFKSGNYTEPSDITYPVIRISDIDGAISHDKKAVHVSFQADGFEVEVGDLLIAMSGATTGKMGVYAGSTPAYQNQRVGNIKLVNEKLGSHNFKNFIFQYLRGDILKIAYGGAQPNISARAIEAIKIPLPPLAEQKVIAEKLDTLLAQVEHTQARLERIPDILKSFRQSVLADAVSGKLTEEWRGDNKNQLNLEDYKSKLEGFKIKAKKLNPLAVIDGWLNCQIGHVITVKSGQGLTAKNMAENGNIPVFGGNGIAGYHDIGNVEEETIVIGRVGFYCGSVHLTPKSAWVTDNALIVAFSEKLLRKDFANLMLLATNLRANTSSSAQPVISATKIYPIQIKIPPIEEQVQIVARVEQLFAYADRIEQQAQAALERVKLLSQSILAKAFRGELTAEWRKQNPELISGENSAEALLAKIKTERKSTAKK